jgi:hypothetical protein
MPSKHIVVSNFEVFKEVVENAREIEERTIKSFCQFK